MSAEEIKNVPPNGKWGWVIAFAYALNGLSTIALLQGFVLIFKDTFPLFGFNATEGSVIINTNLAFGMILGLLNGPLLQIFGYRKMAVIGSIFYSTGVIMMAFVRSFSLIIISYGLFTSLGMCITTSASSYALNSYFTTKRGRATSLAMTITAFGPIVIPQVTTFLTSTYGFQGTILIYGAISLHALVGSLLLHPLKWHTENVAEELKLKSENEKILMEKKESSAVDERNTSFQGEENLIGSTNDVITVQNRRKITISSIDHDAEIGSIYGFDVSFTRQISETLSVMYSDMLSLQEEDEKDRQLPKNYTKISKSTDTINLGSSIEIFNEKSDFTSYRSNLNISNDSNRDFRDVIEKDSLLRKNESRMELNSKEGDEESQKETRTMRRVARLFDVDLLMDPIYVNIMIGMSTAIFAEITFSQLTPFILTDLSLSTNQIASIMSLIATADLIFRCLAPFIGEWLRKPPRTMYTLSLCFLIISRTLLLFADGFISTMSIAVGLGAAKGIRSVFMPLVLPHYVPINKLANASGFLMILNGIVLLSAGPALGIMRDAFGSYNPCIIVMNCLTMLTVVMWSAEMYIVHRRKLQRRDRQQDNS